MTGAAAGTVAAPGAIAGVAVGTLGLTGTATGTVTAPARFGTAAGTLALTGSATGVVPGSLAPQRFAFPGDPANGGTLAASRRGGRIIS